jgi:hypothetical protein
MVLMSASGLATHNREPQNNEASAFANPQFLFSPNLLTLILAAVPSPVATRPTYITALSHFVELL